MPNTAEDLETSTGAPTGSPTATRWLALGAALGLAAAAWGLLQPHAEGGGLPSDAVASVNGTAIRAADYERAVSALSQDRREPLDLDDRRFVLDRLVDEELLVQRGVELGLLRHDRKVRGDLVAAMIEAVVTEAQHTAPTPDDVRRFYDENRDYFVRPGRLRALQLWVGAGETRSEPEARARAERAAERLRAGETFASVSSALGDVALAPLPDALLPATKLREYLSPAAVTALQAMQVGGVSDAIPASGGYRVLVLVDREDDQSPGFEELESQIRSELLRRSGDRALRSYLDELRGRADVRTAELEP